MKAANLYLFMKWVMVGDAQFLGSSGACRILVTAWTIPVVQFELEYLFIGEEGV